MTARIALIAGTIQALAYRIAGYAVTSLLDDPAMLALAFC